MFTFTLTPDHGEPVEVKADSRDVYVWEKSGRDRSLQTFMANLEMSNLYELAHVAAKRQHLAPGDMPVSDMAVAYVLDFEEDDDGRPVTDDADPSRPGA